jgi:hypothetical protein
MRFVRVGVAVISTFCLVSPAFAATVQVTSGEVFIDRGTGYRTVSGTATAKPGDTVMAKVGGTAVVIYDDGCRQQVDVGSVVTVSETSPCGGTGALYPDHTLLIGGLVVGGVVGLAIALSDDDDKKCITQCKK